MTEDKIEPREINWRQLLPWTVLFRSFGVAMGFSKLLLAAAGILVMATGWWLLAVGFFNAWQKPTWPLSYTVADTDLDKAWSEFKESRNAWNLLLETAGPPDAEEKYEPADLADSRAEFEKIKELVGKPEQSDKDIDTARLNAAVDFMLEKKKVTPSQIKMLAEQAKVSETSAKAMVVR